MRPHLKQQSCLRILRLTAGLNWGLSLFQHACHLHRYAGGRLCRDMPAKGMPQEAPTPERGTSPTEPLNEFQSPLLGVKSSPPENKKENETPKAHSNLWCLQATSSPTANSSHLTFSQHSSCCQGCLPKGFTGFSVCERNTCRGQGPNCHATPAPAPCLSSRAESDHTSNTHVNRELQPEPACHR